MKIFTLSIILVFCFNAYAKLKIASGLSHIDLAQGAEEITNVYLTNGKVVKINFSSISILKKLQNHQYDQSQIFEFHLDENRFIINVQTKENQTSSSQNPSKFRSFMSVSYTPSVIESLTDAQVLFNLARIKYKDSQCYNRAHIWTYEWRATHNLFTNKTWLFFTRKYIRKHNFEWWFHVAPSFHIRDQGQIWERIIDPKYATFPLKLKEWTDIFMKNDADCPVVDKYTQWANYPESNWCYVMKSSMYYYQPIDLENEELGLDHKYTWVPAEITHAYKEAFDIEI